MHNHALKIMPSTNFYRMRTKHVTIKMLFCETKTSVVSEGIKQQDLYDTASEQTELRRLSQSGYLYCISQNTLATTDR